VSPHRWGERGNSIIGGGNLISYQGGEGKVVAQILGGVKQESLVLERMETIRRKCKRGRSLESGSRHVREGNNGCINEAEQS